MFPKGSVGMRLGETNCVSPPYFCHQPFCPSAGGPSPGAKFTRGIPDLTIQTGDQIRGLTQKILTAKNNLAVLSVRRVTKFDSY